MQNFMYQNRKKIIISLVAVIIFLAIVFSYIYFFTFHVTGVSPNLNGSISPSTQQLTVSFNRQVKSVNSAVTSAPSVESSASVKDKTIIINLPQGLDINKSYVLNLASVTANDGTVLKNVRIAFKTNNNPTLTDEQLQTTLKKQQSGLPSAYNDPVYKALPYTGDQYIIQAHLNAPTNPNEDSSVGIEVIVYLNDSQEGDDRLSAIQSIEDAALAHLQSIPGVDINNYNIDYTIQDPLT